MIGSSASLETSCLTNSYPAVDLPGTAFHLVGLPVQVPTTGGMAVLLPTWNDPHVPVGPYTEDDPETEVVHPRNVQLIPGYYATLIVHRRGVTAKTAYKDIVGAVQARGDMEICQDVVTWLAQSSMHDTRGTGSPKQCAHSVSPSDTGAPTGRSIFPPHKQAKCEATSHLDGARCGHGRGDRHLGRGATCAYQRRGPN